MKPVTNHIALFGLYSRSQRIVRASTSDPIGMPLGQPCRLLDDGLYRMFRWWDGR